MVGCRFLHFELLNYPDKMRLPFSQRDCSRAFITVMFTVGYTGDKAALSKQLNNTVVYHLSNELFLF